MKVVRKYTDPVMANIDRSALEAAGIMARVLNENVSLYAGMPNTGLLSIQLVVNDEDFQEASAILDSEFKGDLPYNE